LGERVQVDHMTATKNAVTFKYFQACERRSKHIHAQVYSNANARSAKRFLQELVEIVPYKIISIRVDGGSEFMADFEIACEKMEIPLIVLPPARPKYNGGAERGNRTFREKFYACRDLIADSIGAMRFELRKADEKYNTFRPHHTLKGKTPME
jgi:putative transposase